MFVFFFVAQLSWRIWLCERPILEDRLCETDFSTSGAGKSLSAKVCWCALKTSSVAPLILHNFVLDRHQLATGSSDQKSVLPGIGPGMTPELGGL